MTKALWNPNTSSMNASNLARFMVTLAESYTDYNSHYDPGGAAAANYDALQDFSLQHPEAFWSALWRFCGVRGDMGSGPYLIDGDRMPGARFFPTATLNFAENLLRQRGGAPALIFWGEDKVKREMSHDDLASAAARFQAMLDEVGINVGDRVAAIMPNMPETIASMLGASASGAVWSSCSPDFGVKGVLDRFSQIEPRVLVACDGYFYNGKVIDISDKLVEIVAALPSVERIIIVPYAGDIAATVSAIEKAESWDADVAARECPDIPRFEQLPFAHPLYILFSSGTTGAPKCIVHSAGGTLLQHLKEHVLHCDLKPGERLFYFTTCGWMMWNWLVTGLAAEATLLLYDGSPFAPDGNILFDFADATEMAVFGTSAKYIDALKKAELSPSKTHDLSTVRLMTSTGSPLAPESFDYVYEHVKPDVHLASVAGGTDIVSCFVIGNPLKPVWRGEIQGPGLAMDVDVTDDEGRHLPSGKGELVCRKPFPSMPIGFWNDPDGKKYHSAYFERFPGIWHHGDFAEWTNHGGLIIHGRSDATLNPGGVRIGTAEIYRQVEQLDDVLESVVIGQDWDNDVRIVLFVVLREGVVLDDALRDRLKAQIRSGASPRHVPAKIIQVTDIPRTKSGKITELAIRDIVHGRSIKNTEALANPEALKLYAELTELNA
ncbi:MAG: acetoacetate--CoA ligase [Hyphomicrobiaceae bacterium]